MTDPAFLPFPASEFVHIGSSYFAQAHIYALIQEAFQGEVKVTGVSLRHCNNRDEITKTGKKINPGEVENLDNRFNSDKYKYNIFARSNLLGDRMERSVVDCLNGILVYGEDESAVINTLAHPKTQVVTLTVTPQGYGSTPGARFEEGTGRIINGPGDDLCSAATVLTAALYERYKAKREPFAVMSLDNLADNSESMRAAILHYASVDTNFMNWVAAKLVTSNTMVDRITPSGKDFDPQTSFWRNENIPLPDRRTSIFTETWPHISLVMDDQANKVPLLSKLRDNIDSVLISRDVSKYFEMKLRMLNGSHFALGLVGRLSGYDNSHEAMKNPVIKDFMDKYVFLMQMSLKKTISQVSLDEVRADILDRISNIYLDDPLQRLARDGASKLQPRLINPLKDLIEKHPEIPHELLDIVAASWFEYLRRGAQDKRDKVPEESAFNIDDKDADALNLLGHDDDYYIYPEIFDRLEGFRGFNNLPSIDFLRGIVATGMHSFTELREQIVLARQDPEEFYSKLQSGQISYFGEYIREIMPAVGVTRGANGSGRSLGSDLVDKKGGPVYPTLEKLFMPTLPPSTPGA